MSADGLTRLDRLDSEEFHGRTGELESLGRLVRDLTRGWGRSVHLWGPPGIGKTELLRYFYRTVFLEQGDVVPFYYSLPRLSWPLTEFAADFAGTVVMQYLAFNRQPGSVSSEPSALEESLEMLKKDRSGAGSFLAETYRYFSHFPGNRSAALEAARIPLRFTELTGRKVMLLLDDFFHLEGYGPTQHVGWAKETLNARDVSIVFSGRHSGEMDAIAGSADWSAVIESWPLEEMPGDEASVMLQSLLRAAGVELSEELRIMLLRQTGGRPFAMKALVQSFERGRVEDAASLQRVYAASICRGGLFHYWNRILNAALPDIERRRAALEILVTCLREEGLLADAANLPSDMLKSREEIDGALAALRKAGIIHIDCTRARALGDPTLRDFAYSLYRRESGTSAEFVEASLAAEKIQGTEAAGKRAVRIESRARLKDLLLSWSGQMVPRALFSAGDFEKRFTNLAGEKIQEALSADREVLKLPRVVSVAAGLTGQDAGLPAFDADAVAWAVQEGGTVKQRRVCWVVRIVDENRIAAETIDDFDGKVTALQSAGALAEERIVKWLIATGAITDEAVKRASRKKILLSHIDHVEQLGIFIGKNIGHLFPAPSEKVGGAEILEFEMTIPMVSETELVAARAVEQLAENMNFDTHEIGRIKMALVEACINAFEHSSSEEGKVRLAFSARGKSLTIRVENRGRRFAPKAIKAAAGKGKMTKRGWGLSLIQELMDEVEFEPRDDGVSLVMVKHLTGKDNKGD